MAESYGWAGSILRVNLTTGEITTQDDEKYHISAVAGMAYRIMYEEVRGADPCDERLWSSLVSPLTGAGVLLRPYERDLPPTWSKATLLSMHTWAATSAPC